MRGERYIEIPGERTHELPPLLIHTGPDRAPDVGPTELASILSEAEDMLPLSGEAPEEIEERKLELAIQLGEEYKSLLSHWRWGDSILDWVRQCEITFECEDDLRALLRPDLWPHAGRASFVALLMDKDVPTHGVALERAVGLRLTFRQPPPIGCFSNQFLFFLNSPLASSAYRTWSHLGPDTPALLPPERFHFEVLDMDA